MLFSYWMTHGFYFFCVCFYRRQWEAAADLCRQDAGWWLLTAVWIWDPAAVTHPHGGNGSWRTGSLMKTETPASSPSPDVLAPLHPAAAFMSYACLQMSIYLCTGYFVVKKKKNVSASWFLRSMLFVLSCPLRNLFLFSSASLCSCYLHNHVHNILPNLLLNKKVTVLSNALSLLLCADIRRPTHWTLDSVQMSLLLYSEQDYGTSKCALRDFMINKK